MESALRLLGLAALLLVTLAISLLLWVVFIRWAVAL